MVSVLQASDIMLVFYSSTITMMHGPINIGFFFLYLFIRIAGVGYGRSVNVCSGTVGDRQEGLYGERFKWKKFSNGQRTLAVQ